jgi:DNA polymerase-3 subunit beta
MTTLNLKTLAAVNLFASNESTRYYLNGVLVEARADHVMYVATDGHRMMAYRENLEPLEENAAPRLTGDFIIPSDVCKRLKPKSAKYSYQETANLTREGDAALRLTTLDGTAHIFKPIDGTYPDWRRVVPETLSGNVTIEANDKRASQGICFNPDYLVSFKKFAETTGTTYCGIACNGGDPAGIVFSDENAFGVLMPMRAETQAELVSRWNWRRIVALQIPVPETAPEMLQAAE